MEKSAIQSVLEQVQEDHIEIGIRSYSGRGMYGEECLAFTTDRYTSLGSVFSSILQIIARENVPPSDINEIAGAFSGIQSDSMGLGMVYYFPDVEYVDNDEESEEDEPEDEENGED